MHQNYCTFSDSKLWRHLSLILSLFKHTVLVFRHVSSTSLVMACFMGSMISLDALPTDIKCKPVAVRRNVASRFTVDRRWCPFHRRLSTPVPNWIANCGQRRDQWTLSEFAVVTVISLIKSRLWWIWLPLTVHIWDFDTIEGRTSFIWFAIDLVISL